MSRTSPLESRSRLARAVASALGIDSGTRQSVLTGMLAKPGEDTALYWLELALSAAIATLGLVLNSAAVIIGAMLIAPLMTPIIELSMGLAVVSARLIVHGLLRVLASVAFVVGAAALIMLALPFREPTAELLARTSPTVLDLFVAICCALAAAVTTTRPHAGASSTAAGTAIGISLVPPLGATGLGIGLGDARIAEGALLLFVANFCAILTFATLFFALVGFGPRSVPGDAGTTARVGPLARRIEALARRVDRGPVQTRGAVLRLVIPLVLLAAVFVPLQRALGEVSREVRMRAAVGRLVGSDALLADALQMATDVQRGSARVSAVVVGTDQQALDLEERLRAVLVANGADAPLVRVRAVPSASLLPRDAPAATPAADPIDLVSPAQAAERVSAVALGSLRRHWPAAAGTLADAWLELGGGKGITVAAVALSGERAGAALRGVLETVVAEEVGHAVAVDVRTLPPQPVEAPAAGGREWWAAVEPLLVVAERAPGVGVCLAVPAEAPSTRRSAVPDVRATALARAAAIDAARVRVDTAAPGWRIRFVAGRCPEPEAAAASARP